MCSTISLILPGVQCDFWHFFTNPCHHSTLVPLQRNFRLYITIFLVHCFFSCFSSCFFLMSQYFHDWMINWHITWTVLLRPTASCTDDRAPAIIQMDARRTRRLVRGSNGRATTRYRSMAITVLVHTLAVTDNTCNATIQPPSSVAECTQILQ